MKWDKKSLRVFSRHPSHKAIRNIIPVPKGKTAVIRLGSISETRTPYDLEINTVKSIENTMNKMIMKSLFEEAGISSPKFYSDVFNSKIERFPVLAKLSYRSKGAGMKKLDSQEELDAFRDNVKNRAKNIDNPYYLEEFHNYSKEYRIHVSIAGGYFYTCRKMLKQEFAGGDKNWFRNDSNCVWILEENDLFDKPDTWDNIVEDCQKAREALGLSICGFDIKVNKKGNWKILEANSACSFGDKTSGFYINELNKIITNAF